MLIKDIIHEKGANVVTIEVGQTIHKAINRLNEHRIGALVVMEANGEIAGIITERDVLQVCGQSCDRLNQSGALADSVCVSLVEDAMTKAKVFTENDDVESLNGLLEQLASRGTPQEVERGRPLLEAQKGEAILFGGQAAPPTLGQNEFPAMYEMFKRDLFKNSETGETSNPGHYNGDEIERVPGFEEGSKDKLKR